MPRLLPHKLRSSILFALPITQYVWLTMFANMLRDEFPEQFVNASTFGYFSFAIYAVPLATLTGAAYLVLSIISRNESAMSEGRVVTINRAVVTTIAFAWVAFFAWMGWVLVSFFSHFP